MSDQTSPSCRPDRSSLDRSSPAPEPPPVAQVADRLRWLVSSHLDVDPARLRPDTRLGDDLCMDSLAAIELTMAIEDDFDISIPEEVAADARTYGDVLALVTARAGPATG